MTDIKQKKPPVCFDPIKLVKLRKFCYFRRLLLNVVSMLILNAKVRFLQFRKSINAINGNSNGNKRN